MNEYMSAVLFMLGAVGTVIWYFGRQWFIHVDLALTALVESDRRLHDRLETERARCHDIHMRLGVWDKAEHPKLEHQTWVALVNELDLVPAKKAWRVRLVESHNESVKLDDHIEICSRLL